MKARYPGSFPIEKAVVITGAASDRGIGRAVARRLAGSGWSVGIIDLNQAQVDMIAAEIAAESGSTVLGCYADVSDQQAVDLAVQRFETELPPIVAVVNVAGVSDPTPFLEATLAQWDRVMRINATGSFIVTKRIAPKMVDRGLGRIVNFSSTAAQTGGGNYSRSAYAASKGAVESLTRAIALELAPFGVTANVISPALINTDIMGGPITPDRLPPFMRAVPVGRLGTVQEVAALVEFLVGKDAGFITGATYNINGGVRIG